VFIKVWIGYGSRSFLLCDFAEEKRAMLLTQKRMSGNLHISFAILQRGEKKSNAIDIEKRGMLLTPKECRVIRTSPLRCCVEEKRAMLLAPKECRETCTKTEMNGSDGKRSGSKGRYLLHLFESRPSIKLSCVILILYVFWSFAQEPTVNKWLGWLQLLHR